MRRLWRWVRSGYNLARAVGPAIGGFVVAAAGAGIAFLLNAATFFGVIFFLYRWKRPQHEHVESGRVRDAMRAGMQLWDEQPGGALRAGADRRIQPGGEPAAGAAADSGASVRRDGDLDCC